MAQSGYTPLLVYGSSTAAAEPTAPNLTSSANGAELALNYADGKLFYKNSGGNVRLLAIGYGASTVTPTAGGIQYGTGTAVAFTAAGTAGYILQSNGASAPSWVAAPSTSPGGSTTQVQYNNAGAFAGSANLTFDGTTLTANGNTVITSSGATDALRITQTGTGNALLVEDSANPDATPFVIDQNGIVIKGYTSNVSTIDAISVHSSGSTSQLGFSGYNWGASGVARFAQYRSTSGTVGTNGAVVSGSELGRYQFFGDDGAAFIEAARITAAVDGTPGTNDMPGRLVFSTTADGASSPTERMRIDNQGRVGIGITPTNGVLQVGKNITGGVTSHSIRSEGTIQSDVTTSASYFLSNAKTAAASFTHTELSHYYAFQGTFGAGSTVTTQVAFNASSSLNGATNNYGFYSNIASGTGCWNFYANGTASNFFGGNTIISVADNTNAALRITQTGTGNALLVEDSANPDSSPVVIDSDGNVVVGYTTKVTGTGPPTASSPCVQIHGTINNKSSLGLYNWGSTGSLVDTISFNRSLSNTIGTFGGVVTSSVDLGAISFSGDDGTSFIEAARIYAEVDGTAGTNDMPGRLTFSTTADGASSPTERMRIDSSGRVGIGVTPSSGSGFSQRLQIKQADGIYSGLQIQKSDDDSILGVGYWTTTTAFSFVATYTSTGSYLPISFVTSGTERVRISAAGGFSVGTTADPGAGAIYATGAITAYYSDARLKDVKGTITNALNKVSSLSGVYYTNNEVAVAHGYTSAETQVGLLAQDVEAVLPEVVKAAPFDLDEKGNSKSGEHYKTIQYERVIPLLVEAIKELRAEIQALRG